MPKGIENLKRRAKDLIGKNNSFEILSKSDGVFIFCKLCVSKFKIDAVHLKTQYDSHIGSVKHKNKVSSGGLQQQITGSFASAQNKGDSYATKLVTTFLEAGIPLWKLRHPSIKTFFFQEHQEVLPSANALYMKVDQIYNKTVDKIRKFIADCPIYFVVDETTDARGDMC